MRIGTGTVFLAVSVLASGLFAQEATDIEAQVKKLKKQLSMGSVVKNDFRDEKDQKWERIKVTTEQEKDSPFMGAMRFTVEMTDKEGKTICGQKVQPQAKHPAEYAGRDEWTFDFPHGDLDKPKITAYALEYGWETNKVFTPVIQEFNKSESAGEILARNNDPKQKKLQVTGKTKAFRIESGD
jgi:hypothetical protein